MTEAGKFVQRYLIPIEEKEIQDVLPLSYLQVRILLSTLDRDSHGYMVVQDLKKQAKSRGSKRNISEPSVYKSIDLLKNRGLITDSGEGIGPTGRSINLFRASEIGKSALTAQLLEMKELVEIGKEKGIFPESTPLRIVNI